MPPLSQRGALLYLRIGKRLLDLGLVISTAPFWLPLIGLIGTVIRISLGPPVIFRQVRPGLKAQQFVLLKFRTMTNDRGDDGRLLPAADRLTAIGRLLRLSSLDELPELFNVLRGEMSLVGPRPLLAEDAGVHSTERARRHDVRPGITGWAQVNGRNALTSEQKFKLDAWYVDHLEFATDAKILLLTIWRVLTADNITARTGTTGLREISDGG